MFAGTALVLTGFVLAAYAADVLDDSELDTVDARFSIRGDLAPPEDIVIVGIDDPSIRELAERWPFPRTLHARGVKQLRADGARVIGYDVQFTEPSENPADDQELADAIAQAGNVVLATTIVDDRGRTNVFGGDDVLRTLQTRAAHAGYADRSRPRGAPHGARPREARHAGGGDRRAGPEPRDPGERVPRRAALDRLSRQGERQDDPLLPRRARRLPEGHLRQQDRDRRRRRPRRFRTSIRRRSAARTSCTAWRSSPTRSRPLLRDFPLREAPAWTTVALILLFGAVGPLIAIRFGPAAGGADRASRSRSCTRSSSSSPSTRA